MKKLFCVITLLAYLLVAQPASATTILNLNVFDQLQGTWTTDFRETRIQKLSEWIRAKNPDVVVFEEAQASDAASVDSNDSSFIRDLYPYRRYVHEMMGADQKSYGYWMGAKRAPIKEFSEGFAFPGGVARKTEAAVFANDDGTCLGVLALHLSYQNTQVRQLESLWIQNWIKAHEVDCAHWVVTGDFNADKQDAEIASLFSAGFKSLVTDLKPTVGPFNPIRRIYGNNIPNQTIDWAFGWNVDGAAEIIFTSALDDIWLSDHAGIFMSVGSASLKLPLL